MQIAIAPFGARALSPAILAGQAIAALCTEEASVKKWTVFRAVTEAKPQLGVADRALAVLSALLSFHPQEEIRKETVVFPSNRELCMRAHGMPEATLRRHLAELVRAGLIVRRDSPNGKRYARKASDGSIKLAFGFDLSPLVARAEQFEVMARANREERQRCVELRERITLLRRDIIKFMEFAADQALDAQHERIRVLYQPFSNPSCRGMQSAELQARVAELERVKCEADKLLKVLSKFMEMSGNDVHSERHKQDSNPDSSDYELAFEKRQGRNVETPSVPVSAFETEQFSNTSFDRGQKSESLPPLKPQLDLRTVLKACPEVKAYAYRGIGNWAEFVEAAGLARAALGISLDAWEQACAAMGEPAAAVTIATMLERVEAISSPGGYLRALSGKARAGGYHPTPVVISLLRAQLRGVAVAVE